MDGFSLLKPDTNVKYKEYAQTWMCVNRPTALKIISWTLTSLVLLYIVLQYCVTGHLGFLNPASETIKSANRVWLRCFVADDEFAEEVQAVLGDGAVRELATQVNQQLNNLCGASISENAIQTPIYVITPTYRRPEQLAQLTRLAQTLMQVPNIYWLLCEDATEKSDLISKQLEKWRIRFVHLLGGPKNSTEGKTTGAVNCRNEGMRWIRENVTDGVFYFADDDNSYDIDLFEEIRSTKKVATWPVGLLAELQLSTPIVKNGKLAGFYDAHLEGRKFPIYMTGFSVNVKFFKERPGAKMSYGSGKEEDSFLRSLDPFEPEELELKADNCTRLLVWHTQSRSYGPATPLDMNKYANTNLVELRKMML